MRQLSVLRGKKSKQKTTRRQKTIRQARTALDQLRDFNLKKRLPVIQDSARHYSFHPFFLSFSFLFFVFFFFSFRTLMRMVYVQYVIWIYGRIGRGGSSTFEIGTRRIIHGTNYSMTRPTGRHLGKLRAELAVVSSTQGTTPPSYPRFCLSAPLQRQIVLKVTFFFFCLSLLREL